MQLLLHLLTFKQDSTLNQTTPQECLNTTRTRFPIPEATLNCLSLNVASFRIRILIHTPRGKRSKPPQTDGDGAKEESSRADPSDPRRDVSHPLGENNPRRTSAILGCNLYLIKQVHGGAAGPASLPRRGGSSVGLVCALGFIRLLKP